MLTLLTQKCAARTTDDLGDPPALGLARDFWHFSAEVCEMESHAPMALAAI
jgi:hypothetical protein